jgi:hypothetical protein
MFVGEHGENEQDEMKCDGRPRLYLQTMVAPLSLLSLTKNANNSARTRASRSTVTSSNNRTSQLPINPMHSCTRRRSPSEIWCIRLGDDHVVKEQADKGKDKG